MIEYGKFTCSHIMVCYEQIDLSGFIANELSAMMIPLFSRRVNPAGESNRMRAANRTRQLGCSFIVIAPWHRIGPVLWGHGEWPDDRSDNPVP